MGMFLVHRVEIDENGRTLYRLVGKTKIKPPRDLKGFHFWLVSVVGVRSFRSAIYQIDRSGKDGFIKVIKVYADWEGIKIV